MPETDYAAAAFRRQEYTDVAVIGAGPAGSTFARRLAETTCWHRMRSVRLRGLG